jgi:hypothetical protein
MMAVIRIWSHTAAFRTFGTEPRNVRWSWSSRNEDRKIVVVTLWTDRFTRKKGKLTYERTGPDPAIARHGAVEWNENLAWARDHCNGRVRVIVATAKEVTARPRSIAECYPCLLTMKVASFDYETGAFRLEEETQ